MLQIFMMECFHEFEFHLVPLLKLATQRSYHLLARTQFPENILKNQRSSQVRSIQVIMQLSSVMKAASQ